MSPKEKEDYAEALRRIREAQDTGATSLNLGELYSLRQLPPELEGLTSLQELYLCWQFSGDVSPLAALGSLQTLSLSGNQLTRLSESLGKLTGLQTLNLYGCRHLTNLWESLAKLTRLQSLQTLSLSGNRLTSLPESLGELTGLRTLSLSENQFTSLPESLGKLTDLQTLRVSENQLTSLPESLGELTGLQMLDLWCNRLTSLPESLGELTGLQTLSLSENQFTSLPESLGKLTGLQTLYLSNCEQLSGDLSPLAKLTSLRTLYLSKCEQISDLRPLTGLRSLRKLDLRMCGHIGRFAPLESLLSTLQELYLSDSTFDDLPPEICVAPRAQNVLKKVRAYYEDLKSGARRDAEVKVFFLGNGGVGKTQLSRRLQGLEFDRSVPTTHGVQLGQTTVDLEEPVRLNLWDFGGQDIYHGSHALFLHGQGIFLLLWMPELERGGSYEERVSSAKNRIPRFWPKPEGICGMIATSCLLPASSFS